MKYGGIGGFEQFGCEPEPGECLGDLCGAACQVLLWLIGLSQGQLRPKLLLGFI